MNQMVRNKLTMNLGSGAGVSALGAKVTWIGLHPLHSLCSALPEWSWGIRKPYTVVPGPQHTLELNGPSVFPFRLFAGNSIELVYKRNTTWPWTFRFGKELWERDEQLGPELGHRRPEGQQDKGSGAHTCSPRRRQSCGHHWLECKQMKTTVSRQVIFKVT